MTHRENCALKQELKALEARLKEDPTDASLAGLIEEKNKRVNLLETRIADLTKEIESYRGKEIQKKPNGSMKSMSKNSTVTWKLASILPV